jgi:PAS domain S-box-containing protein
MKKISNEQVKDLLQLMVAISPNPVLLVDLAGKIRLVNAHAESLFGYSEVELLGKPIEMLVPSHLREHHLQDRAAFASDPTTRPMGAGRDLFGLHKDGRLVPVEIGLNPISMSSEKYVLASIIDITKRRQAEQALRDSEEKFRIAIQNSNFVPAQFDRELRYLWIYNPHPDLQPSDFIGKRDDELFDTAGSKRLCILKQQVIESGRGVREEISFPDSDGMHTYDFTIEPLYDKDGHIVGGTSAAFDITRQKQAEGALRESEERYRRTLDSMLEGCQIIGFDWRYLYINDASARQGKMTKEALLGRTMMEVYPGIEQTDMIAVLQQCQKERTPAHIENEFAFPDGTTGWFELSIQPAPEGIFILSIDITQRKKFEKEITEALDREQKARIAAEEAQQRLAFLADVGSALASSLDYHKTLAAIAELSVPQIADWCTVDMLKPDGTLNRLAVVHTDPAKRTLAYELQKRYPPDPKAPSGVYNALRTGQPEFYPIIMEELLEAAVLDEEQMDIFKELGLRAAITVPITVRDQPVGVITLVMAESNRLYDEKDLSLAVELANRAGLAIDNARLYHEANKLNEELEQRVQERTAQLEAANKELEAFSYSVSHDLRAPLRSINGFSQALLEDYYEDLEDQAQHYLERVIAASKKMADLIDDMLTLSRLTRNEMKLKRVHLSDLVEEIATQLQQREETERTVEFVIAPEVFVQADVHLIRIALVNLLDNAWKFTAKQPSACIEFGVEPQQDGKAAYFVRDNGAGFEMAYADKLFGAFQRLHTVTEFPGTGIGLATVQRVVRRHGGQVWAEGAVGQGATFYFTLYGTVVTRMRDMKQVDSVIG